MRLSAALFAGCALVCLSASADTLDRVRPGQWDVTLKMNIDGMPQLTPEQVAQMKQFGLQLPVGGQTLTSRQCVAPDQTSLDKAVSAFKGQGGCSIQNYKRVGRQVTGTLACGPQMGSGPFQMQLDSETTYHGRYSLKNGSMNQTGELAGQWRKDRCDPGVPTYR
ncbi:DUF3617 domain-containing protein [Pseudomonas mangiferae]|nr:DUF3617 domain-containing protein [Pseudomonas mangiferae]